jgi:hypothetical protein
MISLVFSALSLTLTPPVKAPEAAPIKLAGLFGKKQKWVEVPQEVQVEYDYAPTVGRRAEPAPQPFVPVRYLTPEQRAEPIIVEPAPRLVNIDELAKKQENAATAPAEGQENAAPPPPSYEAPSYITSAPTAPERPQRPEGWSPPGSATGSNAVPTYGAQQPASAPSAPK